MPGRPNGIRGHLRTRRRLRIRGLRRRQPGRSRREDAPGRGERRVSELRPGLLPHPLSSGGLLTFPPAGCCAAAVTEDETVSREPDGSFNETYCNWCCADGAFVYPSRDALPD
ncbi:MAG: zinc ribbon domain-containing protein [Oscillospiraceae bacterium]|nr:zinc ribbon domain-containing protein [Oscillospiraceae bacterium]